MEEGNPNPKTIIDMKALVEGLDESMRNLDLKGKGIVPSSEYHISMVKSGIRNVDSSQYAPHSILVGPYHCDPDQRMEPVKLEALHGALPCDEQERRSTLHRYLVEIAAANFLAEVRRYYADGANKFEDLALSKLLLVDGFYILHCFGIGRFGGGSSSSGGGMCAQDNIEHIRDVFYLLENQIPFFVLVKIHDLFFPPETSPIKSTAEIVLDDLEKSLRPLLTFLGYTQLEIRGVSPWHLLHLLYMHFKSTAVPEPDDEMPATAAASNVQQVARPPTSHSWRMWLTGTAATTPAPVGEGGDAAAGNKPHPAYRWHGATQYHAAGMTFEKRRLDSSSKARNILDVELRRLTVYIPTITVDNNTFRILRNLLALEQQSPALGVDVTAYCLFMSHLAGTAKDVDLLVRKEVIVHFMGSDEEVAQGFADLCKGLSVNISDTGRNYLHKTWEKMEKRYNSRSINWIKQLQRKHLSNSALVFALLVAMIPFVCTILQTVYAVKSYKASN
ncbi:hypothetical protein DAI22_09g042700 [Oryza sativa Japonica Group]|jgi:hypothetical protein|nr:hypothetical protein DAI22_09g042700 [Oryza sativa Japonica Group]